MQIDESIPRQVGSNGVGRKPSILFINQHYWPDLAATAQQLTDLAEHLAAEGYEVHVLSSRNRYLAGSLGAPRREVHNGVTIHRVRATGYGRTSHLGRLLDYGTFYAQALARLLLRRRYDLVVPLTTPPLLPVAAAVAKVLRRQRYGIWSMDLHPDAEFALGMLKRDSLVGRLLERLNIWSYRKADFVVDLGACMKQRLQVKGIPAENLHTIPVWSRRDEVEPVEPEANPLREDLQLNGQFVVMYSGNAGLAHCFEEVLDAMLRLRDRKDILFLFVGDGPRRDQIEAFIAEHDLANARYLDYFAREKLRYSLPLGDLHLVTLRHDMAGVAVPNKLYGVMAAGRPVVMVGPPDSAPGQTIAGEKIGVVLPAGEEAGGERLADAITSYADRREDALADGLRARVAFLERYDQRVACDAWAKLLRTVLQVEYVEAPAAQPTMVQHPNV